MSCGWMFLCMPCLSCRRAAISIARCAQCARRRPQIPMAVVPGPADSGRPDIRALRQGAVTYRTGEAAAPDDVELAAGRAAAEDELVREVAGMRQAGPVQRRGSHRP